MVNLMYTSIVIQIYSKTQPLQHYRTISTKTRFLTIGRIYHQDKSLATTSGSS